MWMSAWRNWACRFAAARGQNEGRWIILDYGFMLVHIFHTEEYEYYNLERLWTDGSNRLVLPFDQTDL